MRWFGHSLGGVTTAHLLSLPEYPMSPTCPHTAVSVSKFRDQHHRFFLCFGITRILLFLSNSSSDFCLSLPPACRTRNYVKVSSLLLTDRSRGPPSLCTLFKQDAFSAVLLPQGSLPPPFPPIGDAFLAVLPSCFLPVPHSVLQDCVSRGSACVTLFFAGFG